jgi:hypothetical protein
VKALIATSIRAGLGNQMFQYAAARRLAHHAGGELVLVTDGPEPFRLPVWRIQGVTVPAGQVVPNRRFGLFLGRRPRPGDVPVRQEKLIWDLIPQSGTPALAQTQSLLFMPELLCWRGHVLLRGYWQDERYFTDIRPLIEDDFRLRQPLDPRSGDCLSRIRAGVSAFIHVRRGDYLSPEFADLFGTCSADYYHQAMTMLRARVPAVRFFVFSDDPGWVRENQIGGRDADIIDWNGAAPARDLVLMRECAHAIIANSSFGWWGAWLGERTESVIIAPKIWFKAVPEYRDIIPPRWLRL